MIQNAISTNITVQTLEIKKGKPDVRSFEVQAFHTESDSLFLFKKTMRDLTRLRFALSKGCTITDESGKYICTEVYQVPGKSHYAVAVARRTA